MNGGDELTIALERHRLAHHRPDEQGLGAWFLSDCLTYDAELRQAVADLVLRLCGGDHQGGVHNWWLSAAEPYGTENIVMCSCGWGSTIILGGREKAEEVARAHVAEITEAVAR